MIDVTRLRENLEELKDSLKDRISSEKLQQAHSLDAAWRQKKTKVDDLLAKRNALAQTARDDENKRQEAKELKVILERETEDLDNSWKTLQAILRQIPNVPDKHTPQGKSEKDNLVIRTLGKQKHFSFKPKDYLQLASATKSFMIEEGVFAAGSRFSYIGGDAANLEYALLQLAIDTLSQKDFSLVFPPLLLKPELMEGMGYLDQAGKEEVFFIEKDKLYLVGTSEQSLGALFANQTLFEKDLPIRCMSFTPCFRREAGSYGKDVKGILRQHQFEKIEMFTIATPETSDREHALILSAQEEMMKKLKLHYRIVDLCAGDLGLPSSRTFDVETFMPGQAKGEGEYRETHSTSNCTDFQSRRLKIRYINSEGKKEFVHTVNGTGFAMQRILIAIFEQYQQKDGSVSIPTALKKYLPKKSRK